MRASNTLLVNAAAEQDDTLLPSLPPCYSHQRNEHIAVARYQPAVHSASDVATLNCTSMCVCGECVDAFN
jgi:hypothetical protein